MVDIITPIKHVPNQNMYVVDTITPNKTCTYRGIQLLQSKHVLTVVDIITPIKTCTYRGRYNYSNQNMYLPW